MKKTAGLGLLLLGGLFLSPVASATYIGVHNPVTDENTWVPCPYDVAGPPVCFNEYDWGPVGNCPSILLLGGQGTVGPSQLGIYCYIE